MGMKMGMGPGTGPPSLPGPPAYVTGRRPRGCGMRAAGRAAAAGGSARRGPPPQQQHHHLFPGCPHFCSPSPPCPPPRRSGGGDRGRAVCPCVCVPPPSSHGDVAHGDVSLRARRGNPHPLPPSACPPGAAPGALPGSPYTSPSPSPSRGGSAPRGPPLLHSSSAPRGAMQPLSPPQHPSCAPAPPGSIPVPLPCPWGCGTQGRWLQGPGPGSTRCQCHPHGRSVTGWPLPPGRRCREWEQQSRAGAFAPDRARGSGLRCQPTDTGESSAGAIRPRKMSRSLPWPWAERLFLRSLLAR